MVSSLGYARLLPSDTTHVVRMVPSRSKSQLVSVVQTSLPYSGFDVSWIPNSTTLACVGATANEGGAIRVYNVQPEPDGGTAFELTVKEESDKSVALKCCALGARSVSDGHLATGDFDGTVTLWDVEHLNLPLHTLRAHTSIVNAIDGSGATLVTGSRDGAVRVWDVRERCTDSVCDITRRKKAHDCWAVKFASWDPLTVVSGYENGEVVCVDLRSPDRVSWKVAVSSNMSGVCHIDTHSSRKVLATALHGRVLCVDALNPECVRVDELQQPAFDIDLQPPPTLWNGAFVPKQKKDKADVVKFAVSTGEGYVCMYEASGNGTALKKGEDRLRDTRNTKSGIRLLMSKRICHQPLIGLEWNKPSNTTEPWLCAVLSLDLSLSVHMLRRRSEKAP
eukprot:TRINITY_DN5193_c0_g1_i1.p1 TRINITY_DN5193_c0_g1~~TRINITY_DN5193_c0_g1_i1.p1  ORF type:complete len:393 (+),score=72.25 TRINITY_DN5193_c0_g1_i1:223-1401(+)